MKALTCDWIAHLIHARYENKAYKFYLLGIKAGIFGVLGDIFSCVGSNLMPLYST